MGEQPTDEEIQQVLVEESLQIVMSIFGPSPGFTRDSCLLLKLGQQVVTPIVLVLMHQPERRDIYEEILSIEQYCQSVSR